MATTPIPADLLSILLGKKPVSDTLSAIGEDVKGAVQGVPSMLRSALPSSFPQPISPSIPETLANTDREKSAGYSPFYRAASIPASLAGVNVPGMEASARQGSVGGVLGHTVLPAIGAGIGLHGALGADTAPRMSLAAEHPAIASEALLEHAKTGGSTFDPRTGTNLSGNKKWSVGVSPESAAVSSQPFTPEEYAGFANIHTDTLNQHPHSAIGTQFDPNTGLHRMEVVGLTPSKTAASSLANHLGEESIYHIGRDESVPITAGGERSPFPLSLTERLNQLTTESPKPETYSGTHFSDTKLDNIEGARRGIPTDKSGIPTGAEATRLRLGSQTGLGPDAPPGFYTYRSGSLPEPSIGARKNAYPVRGSFSFGSTESPEFQNEYHRVSANALDQGAEPSTAHGLGLNAGEHALRDAGYDGYSSPDHPNTHFIFDNHQITPPKSTSAVQSFEDWKAAQKPVSTPAPPSYLPQTNRSFTSAPESLGFDFSPPVDYGNQVRADVERRMGGPLPRGASERRTATTVPASMNAAPEPVWPEQYQNSPQNLSRAAGAGANYSAQDLASLKTKHNIK